MALRQPMFSEADADSWMREVAVALFVVLLAVLALWAAFAIV